MPCDFVNSRPSSETSASPAAAVESRTVADQSPAVSPGGSPGVSMVGASPEDTIMVNVAGSVSAAHEDVASSQDSSAAAAFAFLEWTLNANNGGPPGGGARGSMSHEPFLTAADPVLDAMSSTIPLTPATSYQAGAPMACPAAEDDLALNMTDLSLLHHFTTSTAADLNPWHAGLQEWWMYEVPRVAFRYPFVMRSLLALAGLHVAYLSQQQQQNPSSGSTVGGGTPGTHDDNAEDPSASSASAVRAFHISRAIEQHKLAGQTASSMLLDLNPTTSAPMYVFSVATLIISLAMPRSPDRVFSWDSSGAVEWVRLMRGTKTIADMGEAWLVEGDMLESTFNEKVLPRALHREASSREHGLGPSNRRDDGRPGRTGSLLAGARLGGSSPHDFNFSGATKRRSRWYVMHEPPLARLREAVAVGPFEESTAGAGDVEIEARHLCLKALEELQLVYTSFLDHGESVQTVRYIFSWVCQLDQRYLDSLSRHNAPCLLLFAYFGVLLHWTDRAWWLEGWGPHIIEAISNILGGVESKYKEYLRWPREQVGLPGLG